MTLPIERTRAVLNTERFLVDLTDPSTTPKVPKAVREYARSLLRHYPTLYYFELVQREWHSPYECPFSVKDNFQSLIKE